jgi:hypothetical protein
MPFITTCSYTIIHCQKIAVLEGVGELESRLLHKGRCLSTSVGLEDVLP